MKEKKEDRQERKILPICFLCNTVPPGGIASGFLFKGVYICAQCESDLINCNISNQVKYKATIEKIRKILFKRKPGKCLPGFNR